MTEQVKNLHSNVEIEIDASRCDSCYLCIAVCITNKFILPKGKKGIPGVDKDAPCFGCEDCVIICEANAITLREKGDR